jgi:hypothetical protein
VALLGALGAFIAAADARVAQVASDNSGPSPIGAGIDASARGAADAGPARRLSSGGEGAPAEDPVSSLSALISTGFGCLGRVPSKTALAGGAPAANGVTVVSEAHKAPPPSPPQAAAPADAAAALDTIVSAAGEAGAVDPASPQQRGVAAAPPAVPSAPLAFSPTAPAAEARPPAATASPPPPPPPEVASPPPSQVGVTSPPGSSVGAPAASGYASLSPVMYESLQPRGRAKKEGGAASSSPAAALFLDTAPASPALSAGRRSPLRGGAARPAWAETAVSPPAAALRPADVSSPPASAAVSPRTVATGAALHSLLAPGGSSEP